MKDTCKIFINVLALRNYSLKYNEIHLKDIHCRSNKKISLDNVIWIQQIPANQYFLLLIIYSLKRMPKTTSDFL